jgi:hypothetical protein
MKKILGTIVCLMLVVSFAVSPVSVSANTHSSSNASQIQLLTQMLATLKALLVQLQSQQANSTASWKTYSNTEFDFSVKYPSKLNPFTGATYGDSLISDSQTIINFVTDAVMVIVDSGSTLEKVLEAETKIFRNYSIETKKVTVDGIAGKYVYVKNHPDGPAYIYIVQKGDIVYRIFVLEKFLGSGNSAETFVSTFKFTAGEESN